MGTRSTVKFYSNEKNILSVYQQYDGYVSGVGEQLAHLFKKYQIVNGLPLYGEGHYANGFEELALFYVMDNKDGSGNIYATTEDDEQNFNYEIYSGMSTVQRIRVHVYGDTIFDGDLDGFMKFVENGD